MAYVDAQLLLSDAQALTATAASTNTVDLSASTTYLGTGEAMALVVTVDTAAGGTSPTLTVAVQSDSDSAFGSAATVASSGSIAGATLTAGYQFVVPIPSGVATERYVRAYYTLGGTSPTVTLTASIKPLSMVGNAHYYPSAIDIA